MAIGRLETEAQLAEFLRQQLEGSSVDARIRQLQGHIVALEAALQSGTGSPETVVAADVGALYVDVAGGAGTTLYVKESGTGNVGWAAK